MTGESAAARASGAAVVPMPRAVQGPVPLQRSRGTLRVAFKRRGPRTVLADLHQAGCCKVRFPAFEPGRLAESILINTAGGLTDGDALRTAVRWESGTTAAAAGQAAERIYRSRGDAATVDTRLEVAEEALAFWLPQETILFDGGRLQRRTVAEIDPAGRLLACEALVFGRAAMGETVRSGAVSDAWRVRVGGRLVFADGFRVTGDIATTLGRPGVAGGACAMATLLYAGPDAEALLAPMRAICEAVHADAGCSRLGPIIVVRLLAPSGQALHEDMATILGHMMARLSHGRSIRRAADLLPRVWSC